MSSWGLESSQSVHGDERGMLCITSLLQEFQDVFPDELPPGLPPLRGIEHCVDLIPGAPLPNKAPYRINPEETKEIQRQVQQLIDNAMYEKV